MSKIYRITVRQAVEMTFRVRAESRNEAENKAVSKFSQSNILMTDETSKTLPPLRLCSKIAKSCEAVGTSEDKNQTIDPDIP